MTVSCPNCGTPVASTGAGLSVCTTCGSDVHLNSGQTTVYRPTGRTFGRFQILAELGSGAFGTVYKATDPQLDRTVALKIPNRPLVGDPDSRERFLREARSAARLPHPNIVQLYEVGECDEGPYLVSELVEGPSLADTLTAKRPSFPDAAKLVAALADALHFAHTQGVIHRDVKPSNVLLGPTGEPRLTDFGIARRENVESTLTTEGQVLGTPAYMSPEQARGEGGRADGRADVYSLGAVLYQLLTGELPFRGNARMTLHQVLHDDPRPPRGLNDRVPRDLETVCLKCLEKEPAKRYATAGELATDLRRFLADQPVLARPPSRWDRARKFVRRNRPLVFGTTATLLALALGIAGTTWGMFRANTAADREADEARRANEALADLERAKKAQDAALARTAATAAKLATQRGQWREGLANYRTALEYTALSGEGDEIALRIGIAACHSQLYDFKAYREEVDALAARTDLGKHAGMVKMLQGLGGFFGSDPTADPIGAFREAVALGLPPAEDSYAKAILSATVPEMSDHLRAAIRHDPFHVRAHDLLIMGLIVSGRLAEAREVMARFEVLAPNAVNGVMYRAMERSLAGDLPTALARCDDLTPLVGEKWAAASKRLIRMMVGSVREDTLWEPDLLGRAALITEFLSIAPEMSALVQDEKLAATWATFNAFRMGPFSGISRSPVFHAKSAAEVALGLADVNAGKKLAADFSKTLPMGLFELNSGFELAAASKFADAEAAFKRAIDMPSFMPVARRARYELFFTQASQTFRMPLGSAEREKKLTEARATLRQVARDGPYPANYTASLCSWANTVGEPALALGIAEEWVKRTPTDRKALEALAQAQYVLGQWPRVADTLDKLMALDPKADPAELLNRKTVTQFNQRIYSLALALAFDTLRTDPTDKTAQTNIQVIGDSMTRSMTAYPYLREKVRVWQCLHLAQTGNHRCATAGVDDPPADAAPEKLTVAAAVYSRAAEAAKADELLSPQDRTEFAEHYAGRALDLLRRAGADYLTNPNRALLFSADPDFAFLRTRPDCPPGIRTADRK